MFQALLLHRAAQQRPHLSKTTGSPMEQRAAEWSGWCPQVFEELNAMNPVGFGNETDTLLRARRSQVYEDGLPVFPRDACPDVLFKILTVVNFLPSIALTKVQGVVVRERSE